jgi:uncharacterized protein (DUF488 family)
MKIYTGYFAKNKEYQKAGLFQISIARFNKYFNGVKLPALAPTAEMIHEPKRTYVPKYRKILSRISVEQVVNEIKKASGGKDVVLLCYEKPTEFCHRQLVATWLGEYCEGEYQKKESESLWL